MQFCNLFVIMTLVVVTKCNFLRKVTVIFANLQLRERIHKLDKFIKNNRIVKFAAYCVMAAAAVIITLAASGITLGYNVSYCDRVIAVVSCKADYNKADAIVSGRLDSKTAREASIKPEFGITLTVSSRINNTEEIVEAIVNNNDEIIEATALMVNGEPVICVNEGDLQAVVDERLAEYNTADAQNSASFADDVKVEKGYFLKANLVDEATARDVIEELTVKTVTVITKEIEIPYETKNVKTDKEVIGYSKVTTKGENGLSERVEEIVKINGKIQSKTKISETVIKKQVTEVVTIGTGINRIDPTHKAHASGAGFICPLPKGQFIISAYYGDGRNHKGIDLAADCGTPIFAAASGTVVYAGWDGDYGYSVIIQHSNGLKTRYAHCNALCVSVGAKVARGDMIATVGSTGWSTGNHLHFEVIVNGNRVNPGPYIGLN